MRNLAYRILFVGIALAAFAQLAQAGILATTGNAIPGFSGSRTYSDGPAFPPFLNDEINVDVDYAAFAPADSGQDTFDDFLSEFVITFAHSVPSDHYVYAYQAHVLAPTDPAAHIFTVGTQFSGELGGSAPSYIPLADYGNGGGENGDEEPTDSAYQGSTSAYWEFLSVSNDGLLDPGEWSAIVFFSAIHGPTWDSTQINAGIASASSNASDPVNTGVPSPAPEPGTLTLLGLGLFMLSSWRRKRLKD